MLLYSLSFSMLGVQFIAADVFHLQMTDFNGNPIKNVLINGVQINTLNTVISNSTCQNNSCNSFVNNLTTFLSAAPQIGLSLFTLLTGSYIFLFLYQIGVPIIFMVGFIALYAFLLIRTILAYIRGA